MHFTKIVFTAILAATSVSASCSEGFGVVQDCCYRNAGAVSRQYGEGDICTPKVQASCGADCCAPSTGYGIGESSLPLLDSWNWCMDQERGDEIRDGLWLMEI